MRYTCIQETEQKYGIYIHETENNYLIYYHIYIRFISPSVPALPGLAHASVFVFELVNKVQQRFQYSYVFVVLQQW